MITNFQHQNIYNSRLHVWWVNFNFWSLLRNQNCWDCSTVTVCLSYTELLGLQHGDCLPVLHWTAGTAARWLFACLTLNCWNCSTVTVCLSYTELLGLQHGDCSPVLHWTSCILFNSLPTVQATYIKPNNTTTVNELPRICHQTAVTSTTTQTLAWSNVKDQSVSYNVLLIWGTRWRSWLRSIPDSVTGIFHWHNPSNRTIALGLTQHLTEMSNRNISWG
jgi:hypothetical protein